MLYLSPWNEWRSSIAPESSKYWTTSAWPHKLAWCQHHHTENIRASKETHQMHRFYWYRRQSSTPIWQYQHWFSDYRYVWTASKSPRRQASHNSIKCTDKSCLNSVLSSRKDFSIILRLGGFSSGNTVITRRMTLLPLPTFPLGLSNDKFRPRGFKPELPALSNREANRSV